MNTKVLRSLIARTYELVRTDLPRKRIEVDYAALEKATSDQTEFAKIYGITFLDKPIDVNAAFPYTLSGVASELEYKHWSYANLLIEKIHDEHGVDIKATDNCYHVAIKTGPRSRTHKYSEAGVNLLKMVKNGENYVLNNK